MNERSDTSGEGENRSPDEAGNLQCCLLVNLVLVVSPAHGDVGVEKQVGGDQPTDDAHGCDPAVKGSGRMVGRIHDLELFGPTLKVTRARQRVESTALFGCL